MVDSFSSRGGRGATWTFAGRDGSPGIFNAWLPSLTPTGVGAGSSSETTTYNAGSQLVTSVEGAVVSTYTFDANGNQTAVNAGGSRTTYAYDYENRMRTAIDPGGARSTLAYWADGMRRFLEVGGTRTTFVWDGSDYLQARTPSEVTTFSTVDAQILDSETGGSESLLVPDPLGSVVKVLDASGNQVYDASYWPYGEVRSSVGVNDTSWGYVGTWGYHFDTSRRLYIRARVLDPLTGRWYSVDPLWPSESAYQYVNSQPLVKSDPSGWSLKWHWLCRGKPSKFCRWFYDGIPYPSDPRITSLKKCLDESSARCDSPNSFGTDPSTALDQLINNTSGKPDFQVQFGGALCGGRCGYTEHWTRPPTIHICADAYDTSKCGSPECTIMHEILHVPGMTHAGLNEEAWDCLRASFGCPERSRSK